MGGGAVHDSGSSLHSRAVSPDFEHQTQFVPQKKGFLVFKRVFDIGVSLALLPILGLAGLTIFAINHFLDPGSLFFVQKRMGRHCIPFHAFKFRTMVAAPVIERGAFDALEQHRITRLGRFLRRSRLDELPQVINVLRGEMSLIGPRPDYIAHAEAYLEQVPGYRERHAVRPGISGLAQVTHGYVDGLDGVVKKVAADLHYIREASIRIDLWIAWRTFVIVIFAKGA